VLSKKEGLEELGYLIDLSSTDSCSSGISGFPADACLINTSACLGIAGVTDTNSVTGTLARLALLRLERQ
jgi:hypothetical protein